MRIAIIGAGGHGKVVADAILAAGRDQIFGFFDDNPTLQQNCVLGFPVLGPIAGWQHHSIDAFALGIGDNAARKRAFEQLKSTGATFVVVVHPRATLGRGVIVGEGTVVFANVAVNVDAQIGPDCILNTACTIDHDCAVAAHSHIAPGVNAAGHVRIGEGALVGIGARIIPRVSIGDWAVVGAGAVVNRDVEAAATVAGIPAKAI